MKIPLLDLKAQYQSLKPELDQALLRVAESQYFILGPEVDNFEKEVASYTGAKHAIGMSSGTDALLAALMALDIGPGDEVIVPDYTFFATAGVVARLGATPVFADIDPVSFNLSIPSFQHSITPRTKAVIPVHLFGQAANMDAIMDVAGEIPVVEDAAQAIGVRYKDGRQVGTIGLMGCFSFFPSKNLGGYGDGGLVTTNDDALARKLRDLRMHGMNPKYYHKFVGGNFRLDAIQAAVLRVKLPHLEKWNNGRWKNAAVYHRLFQEAGLSEGPGRTQSDGKNPVLTPASLYSHLPSNHPNLHIYNQYVIRVDRRDALRDHLSTSGVATEIYYPVPLHQQECFRYLKGDPGEFPVSISCAQQSLALPVYPELTEEQLRYVVDCIAEFFGGE